MIESLKTELSLQQHYLDGAAIETIYFGGGTPSLLSGDELGSILNEVRNLFHVVEGAEVTLESNPDDLSDFNLEQFRNVGINRLSIGIQTFDDAVLRFLNRAHTSSDASAALLRSRQAGFQNISIDLIYAIPGQRDELWIDNLRKAIALAPEHISAYNLTIEPQTVFGRWNSKGKLVPVIDDSAALQLETLIEILSEAGYQQYEISNFCKPGFESRHNTSYWQRKSYLGIGPSAHSYNKESRQYNVRNNHTYVKALSSGNIPYERELLTREDKVNEYLLTTLRTVWGADLALMVKEYNYDLLTDQKEYIDKLLTNGLAVQDNTVLQLTNKGKMMADRISSDLFLIS